MLADDHAPSSSGAGPRPLDADRRSSAFASILRSTRDLLNCSTALFATIANEAWRVEQVDDDAFGIGKHDALDLGPDLRACIVAAAGSAILPNAACSPLGDESSIAGRPGVGGLACVPLILADGAFVGLLCALDPTPFPRDDRAERTLRLLAHLAASELERERIAWGLHIADAKYRALIEHLPVVTYLSYDDEDGQVRPQSVSPQIESLTGYTSAEWSETPGLWQRLIHDADRERVLAEVARTTEHGAPFHAEYRLWSRDGREVWVRDDAALVRDAAGGPLYWQGVLVDITPLKRTEAELRSSEERLHLALDAASMAMWDWNLVDHTFVRSPGMAALYGLPSGSLASPEVDPLGFVHPDDRPLIDEMDRRHIEENAPYVVEYRVNRPDGATAWLREQGRSIPGPDGTPERLLGVTIDVTARRLAEEAARESEGQFRLLFAANPHPMWVFERETLRFLEVNDAAIAHYGYTRAEFLAMTVDEIRPPDDASPLPWQSATDGPILGGSGGRRHRTKDQRLIDVEVTSHLLTFRGRPAYLVVAQDVSARLSLERQLAHQAFHDPLTGLPNRAHCRDRLAHVLAEGTDGEPQCAVLFLDLDEFKVINDTLGHEAGDRLLVALADRLRHCVRGHDTLARLGGDEFTILLERLPEQGAASEIAARVTDAIRAPFHLEGREVVVTASIGISTPGAACDPDEVLRLADVAMYEAKHRGKDQIAYFNAGMDAPAWRRLGLEVDLRRAIAERQFVLHYQPVVALSDGRTTAVEALIRWQHPERGSVPPVELIPLAEETGLIVPLGQWVLETACRQAAAWQADFPAVRPLGLSVNLSTRQLQHPGLVDEVAGALAASGFPASSLTLEMTETAALDGANAVASSLRGLRALGVRLAIDDFGAGFAGLGYLRRCPVDAIKLDRAFVSGLDRNAADEAMVRAIIEYARAAGLTLTAEGIETEEQAVELRSLGCSLGQGFWFARPMAAEAMFELLSGQFPVRRSAADDAARLPAIA
jgi:diguanylate cyclase (GGDEF)-like protein/PAS domain S-box-containing protein